MEAISVDQRFQSRVAERLHASPETLRIADDNPFPSLCAAVAIYKEISDPRVDRLSRYLGITEPDNLDVRLFEHEGDIGIAIARQDGSELQVKHKHLARFLDPLSLVDGELRRAVFFPRRIARKFAQEGVDLVVVRDWIIGQAFVPESERVDFLHTDDFELFTNAGKTQAQLMAEAQLCFFSSHDLIDHLLEADVSTFLSFRENYQKIFQRIDQLFPDTATQPKSQLIIAYLIGMYLDDLAQPYWYGSHRHFAAIGASLDIVEQDQNGGTSLDEEAARAYFTASLQDVRGEDR